MRAILVPAIFALAIAAPALADDCVPTTHDADLTTPTCLVDAEPCYYVADDFCIFSLIHPPNLPELPKGFCSIWVYEESNGIAGLQRGDEVVDDTCNGVIPSDTIIF